MRDNLPGLPVLVMSWSPVLSTCATVCALALLVHYQNSGARCSSTKFCESGAVVVVQLKFLRHLERKKKIPYKTEEIPNERTLKSARERERERDGGRGGGGQECWGRKRGGGFLKGGKES